MTPANVKLCESPSSAGGLPTISYSDFGKNGGINVKGHFISLDYVLFPHLTLTAKNYLLNFINCPVAFHNPTQSRLQLDMLLSF